ncbi:MAG: hypothetical protein P8O10_05385 [Pseudorhodobacter sp.]|nr:hypothetical protein [Pseudorhodobacter sp.]
MGFGLNRSFWMMGGCLLLIACGTPQERCINTATRDLRILDRLIGETEANIARGFAIEEVTRTSSRWTICQPGHPATRDHPARRAEWCFKDYRYTVERPKAINLTAEREKLAGMQQKRAELARTASPAIAQCKATHPE